MGLYDDRLADLSERRKRVAQRKPSRSGSRPFPNAPSAHRAPSSMAAARRPTMSTQSLLFSRSDGWTESKAKAWAKSHGYRYGKVDVTDRYIRLRQFDPKGTKVKRTTTFGRGIRAVIAREGVKSMATVKASRRRRPAKKKARKARKSGKRRARRRVRETKVAQAPRRRRRRRVHVQAPRRRRAGMVMQATVQAPRRRRRRRRVKSTVKAWRGNKARHATAARKGWRKRKARKATRGRRRRKVHTSVMEAPRRRRRRRRVHAVAQAPRRRRHRRARMYASRGGSSGLMSFGMALVTGGVGFLLADGLDRFLATYNPSAAEKPKDKFTSDGAGTLANTLNVAAMPNLMRLGAGAGLVVVPAVGSMYVRNAAARSALEGIALGAGLSLVRTLWNNVLMPMLKPKNTAELPKSYVARLYPAEVAAAINLEQKQTAVSSSGSGALSGAPDVGPFALSGDSPYPDAAQALRREAGVHDQFPSMQNVWGTGGPGSNYPTAAQAMGTGAPYGHGNPGQPGVSYAPGPPDGPGPGPQAKPHTDPSCGCIGEANPFLGFIGDAQESDTLFNTNTH